jgi:putative membrane protein
MAIPLSNLLQFLLHFGVVIVIVGVFALLWLKATPFDDIALIRAGNTAAAVAFAGTLVGFAIPVAGVVRASTTIGEVLPWSAIALIAQLLGLWLATRVLHGLVKPIQHGEVASGVFVAGIAITIGILNAACMGG